MPVGRREDGRRRGPPGPDVRDDEREIVIARASEDGPRDDFVERRGMPFHHRPGPTSSPGWKPPAVPRRHPDTQPARLTLVIGAIATAAVPWLLRLSSAPRVGDAEPARIALLAILLKVAAVSAVLVFVAWRLARSHSTRHAMALVASAWLVTLGAGLVVAGRYPIAGTLLFDGGIGGVLWLLVGDGHLRRRLAHR